MKQLLARLWNRRPGAARADYRRLIDPEHYLATYPDVAEAGLDPANHFAGRGWAEGRQPNAFFDAEYYLTQNPDVEAGGFDPLYHYCRFGWQEGRDPHPGFQTNAYLSRHRDVARAGLNPLAHWMRFGRHERRRGPKSRAPEIANRTKPTGRWAPTASAPLDLPPTPLVSIIIVNWNGEEHLEALFASLRAQTYNRFEIIFVDNASKDGSVARARRSGLPMVIHESGENLGFSGGNNVGYRLATGSVIVLLNNDVTVEPDWLEALVGRLERDPWLAASTSLIYFQKPFIELTIEAKGSATGFRFTDFIAGLPYPKAFVQDGHEEAAVIPLHPGAPLTLFVPEAGSIDLPFTDDRAAIEAQVGGMPLGLETQVSGEEGITLRAGIPAAARKDRFWVINNAGSDANDDGDPFDRGIGERDRGQFTMADYVPYVCGCSFAFKRAALGTDDLFFEPFFAYYEDSELSRRLRSKGYGILYAPDSKVYHYHSATSVEKSARWRVLTYRNKFLFDMLAMDKSAIEAALAERVGEVRHVASYYRDNDVSPEEKSFATQAEDIVTAWQDVAAKITSGAALLDKGYRRIGVYNTYWNTHGGGEVHALLMARHLTRYGDVELISEGDFDLERLGAYFDIDVSGMTKRVIHDIYDSMSSEYDIFVNSTFLSTHVSKAPVSLYIVSFPGREANDEVTGSYHFLANSHYTAHWTKEWWGDDAKIDVVWPAVRDAMLEAPPVAKDKLIVNVGRFTPLGHSKKQLELVEAFGLLLKQTPAAEGWRLKLLGSARDDDKEAQDYLAKVRAAAEGLPVDITVNAPFTDVNRAMSDASIYWHMTGYGEDPEASPELFEHFGMTVVEAAARGAYPIVINIGGPKEIVETLGYGEAVATPVALAEATAQFMRATDADGPSPRPEAISQFSEAAQAARLDQILCELGVSPTAKPSAE